MISELSLRIPEMNSDPLTLVFVALIVFLPMTLHILFGGERHPDTSDDDTTVTDK